MPPKKTRLTTAQFSHYFKIGRRVHSPIAQLIYCEMTELHCAVVVGKKTHPKAVDRNRLRRRLYAVLYRTLKQAHKTGVYIVISKPPARSATAAEIAATIHDLLGRVAKSR